MRDELDEARGYTNRCQGCGQLTDMDYCSIRCKHEAQALDRMADEVEEDDDPTTHCYFCEDFVPVDARVAAHDAFDPTCDLRDRPGKCLHAAHDDCLTSAAEDADERMREDFYGSSSPQTQAEREAMAERHVHDK